MTVCIAAICRANGSDAVVIASDRMVTMGNLIEFEHGVPKITTVTPNVVMLTAGDALRGARLAAELANETPDGERVAVIADKAARLYARLRLAQAESEIVAVRGIGLMEFYRGLQPTMLPQLVAGIDQAVSSYNFGLEVLLAGVDDLSARVTYIGNPGGIYQDLQPIGYHAIGSGALHALQSLIGFGHTPDRDLAETVFTVYASKRRAEVAPGVGKDTDLLLISNQGQVRVADAAIAELDKLYEELQQRLSDDHRKRLAALDLGPAEGGAQG